MPFSVLAAIRWCVGPKFQKSRIRKKGCRTPMAKRTRPLILKSNKNEMQYPPAEICPAVFFFSLE